jgi:UrcA family protein
MSKLFNIKALGLVVASAVAVAAPASAQSALQPVGIQVRYADLDIGHVAGAQILLHRIQVAAANACGGAPDLRELQQRADFDHCRNAAVGAAIARVGSPMLAAVAAHEPQTVRVARR